ncbi:Uncharacterised protein [Citrobacter youngae]|nr:Uncharacterised protein [Citrobacter youngae]
MNKTNYPSLTNYLAKTKRTQIFIDYIIHNFLFSAKVTLRSKDFISIISQDIWSRREIF